MSANSISTPPTPYNEAILEYNKDSAERERLTKELDALASENIEIPVVIGGEKFFSGNPQAIKAPHNHQQALAKYHPATTELAQKAVASATEAQKEWALLPWEERASVFLRAAELLATKYRQRMNAATMLGQSKNVYQSEIDAVCELVDFWRFNAHFAEKIYSEQPQSSKGVWNRTETRGLEGFVFAITPFNFTSIAANLPTAPALMGCASLWKPSSTSILSNYIAMQILEEAGLPPGVCNFIPGPASQISKPIFESEHLAGLHFTGSTATFNLLWQNMASNINKYNSYPRIVGETGGKDFVFAHESADPDSLIVALVRGAFEYQGQKCSAASRAYIPRNLWSRIKEPLIDMINSIKMGDISDFQNFMGAVIDKASFDKIKSYIDDAQQSTEAKIIAGGEADDTNGYFIRPTLVEATNPTYKSMVEEIFGPLLTVYIYDETKFDHTLDLCDQSSPYALTGAIFARDRRVIHHMSQKLRNTAGNFYINDKPTGAVVGQQPFGGGRASGTNDKAGSTLNLQRWCSIRTMKENFAPPLDYRYPHMD